MAIETSAAISDGATLSMPDVDDLSNSVAVSLCTADSTGVADAGCKGACDVAPADGSSLETVGSGEGSTCGRGGIGDDGGNEEGPECVEDDHQ